MGFPTHDIALVHLGEPAYEVPAYPVSDTAMTDDLIGEAAFYVGYGMTDGTNQVGAGVKRSVNLDVTDVGQSVYTGEFAGRGICFGDSGGPGLLRIDDEWRVVGINSGLGMFDPDADPCQTYSFSVHTRVDRYAAWIAEHQADPFPDCREDATACLCEEACRPDGTCAQGACETKACGQIYWCLKRWLGSRDLSAECYRSGDDAGRLAFDELVRCMVERCPDLDGVDDFDGCISTHCPNEGRVCVDQAERCPITGGGCPAGQACHVGEDGSTDCLPSHGVGAGDRCDAWGLEAECADGLTCWSSEDSYYSEGICVPMCKTWQDCPPGSSCRLGTFFQRDDIGVCPCNDRDEDGTCPPADCDDWDPSASPYASESCGDQRDNDCDGEVDEECASEPKKGSKRDRDRDDRGCAAPGSPGPLPAVWAGFLVVWAIRRSRRGQSVGGPCTVKDVGR